MMVSSPASLPARALLGLVLPLLVFLACGRKGPPVPPRPVAPAAVEAFRAEARDSAILVTWSRPSRNEDGTPLTDLSEFRLYRAVGTALARGATERPAFSLLATVRAEQPDNATVLGSQYAFQDDGGGRGMTPGLRYTYRVQPVNRRGNVGAPSVEAFVDFALGPARPASLVASAADGIVDLTWQAPTGPEPAGSVSVQGYNVYRGVRSGEYPPMPLNAQPLADRRFRDIGVENETTYYYVVRAVGQERGTKHESPDSNEVSATPQNFTPPSPPHGLVAVPGSDGVALTWDVNPESDLLGYLVYRREPPSLASLRLTEGPIRVMTFTDRTARPGVTYIYSVTALDRSPHRNESAPSPEVSVSLP